MRGIRESHESNQDGPNNLMLVSFGISNGYLIIQTMGIHEKKMAFGRFRTNWIPNSWMIYTGKSEHRMDYLGVPLFFRKPPFQGPVCVFFPTSAAINPHDYGF